MLSLVHQLSSVIASRVSRGERYALVDYPDYNNPGDAAIWLGTRIVLEEVTGRAPDYVSTLKSFDAAACVSKIGDGCVFLLGGGSFGSLYGKHHARRLAAISALPRNRIVQLPFSLAGLDGPVVAATRKVVQAHPALMLIARDGATSAKARALFDVEVLLAPDPAHALRINAPAPTRAETRLLRRDQERWDGDTEGPEEDRFDWADIGRLRWLNRVGKVGLVLAPASARLAVMDRTAQLKVTAAVNRLALGERVVTDRLHGMILAQMIGRDVAVRDNATGKVAAYLDTWGASLAGVGIVGAERAA